MTKHDHIIEPLRQHAEPVENFSCDPANANQHPERNMRAITESLSEFGQRQVLVANQDGTIIAGNGRLEAARKLGWETLAVVRVDDDEITALRYAIADNRTGKLSEWDSEALPNLLQSIDAEYGSLAGTGFNDDDLDELLSDMGTVDEITPGPDAEIDRAEELRKKWGVEMGQVWEAGKHTIICGDSRKHEFDFDVLFFDPPWDEGFLPEKADSVLAFTDGARAKDVVDLLGAPTWVFVWDCVTSWYTPNRPLRRGKQCWWYGDIEDYDFDGSHYGDSGENRTVSNTRGSYEFSPDPRGKHLSDVFSHPITQLHGDSEHSHSKPLDWIRMIIANCTDGVIYDPFLGSGVSLVACEQIGRRCIGVEIEPKFVAVALERLNQMGTTPEVRDG